jgi:hypothetical protein
MLKQILRALYLILYSEPSTHRKTEKERQIADERGSGGGAKSYDGEKAWPSINHSVYSGQNCIQYEYVLCPCTLILYNNSLEKMLPCSEKCFCSFAVNFVNGPGPSVAWWMLPVTHTSYTSFTLILRQGTQALHSSSHKLHKLYTHPHTSYTSFTLILTQGTQALHSSSHKAHKLYTHPQTRHTSFTLILTQGTQALHSSSLKAHKLYTHPHSSTKSLYPSTQMTDTLHSSSHNAHRLYTHPQTLYTSFTINFTNMEHQIYNHPRTRHVRFAQILTQGTHALHSSSHMTHKLYTHSARHIGFILIHKYGTQALHSPHTHRTSALHSSSYNVHTLYNHPRTIGT